MCGIGGYCGTYEPAILSNILGKLSHRGPDDSGIWKANNVGLVHTRLSIIDLSEAGHQPMCDRNVVITYNGEIYNYKELRKQLIIKGEQFKSESDTEVILKLYHQYGISLVDKLNGIFAFAIWDENKQCLFVARDQLGVKPFYYAFTDKGFIFASELKALLITNDVKREIDPVAIVNHLTYLWSPGSTTMLSNVKKLEPGHGMLITEGKLIKKWRYYDISFSNNNIKLSEESAINRTRYLVKNAVAKQLIADVPVGAFLSGGLDSSAVVACAKLAAPHVDLQCFTIDLQCSNKNNDGIIDDLPYAKKVAQYLDVKLNVITVGSEIINSLEKMIYYMDEPQADPAPLNALLISQLAREQGIKVLLSGAGGDDIFTGYRRHFAINQECYWKWMPKLVRQRIQWLSQKLPQNINITRRISKAFRYAGLDDNERLVSYFYWIDPKWLNRIINPEILEQLPILSPAEPLLSTLSNISKDEDNINRMLYLECKHFLADHNLNYTDKMGMAEGIEVRVPLLDTDLIEFVSSLPVHYKQRGREGKWIFKKAMEGLLPNDIIYRPKTGFGAPLKYWLRNELKEIVDDVLSSDSLKRRGLFNPLGVQELIIEDRNGRIDAAYSIFSILCIEMWCKLFIDNASNIRS